MIDKICVICKKYYIEYGNSASPIAKGRCCDNCHETKVLPSRLNKYCEMKQ